MTDFAGALWIPNGNCFVGQNHPRYVILHGTAGGSSAQAIAQFFQSTQGTDNPVSATYVIDQQAVIVQCNRETDGAWANGVITGPTGVSGDGIGNGFHDQWWDAHANPNTYTISIEHVKSDTQNASPLTDAQKLASFHLIKDICIRNNIPMHKADALGGITGHYAIDPIDRQNCPGPYPWDELWTFLEGANGGVLSINQVSDSFIETQKDARWHCKSTGYDIAYGILTYYRMCTLVGLNGYSQYGLPLTGEQAHPKVKSATFQVFERGVIVYDPQNADDRVPGLTGPCYPGHLDRFLSPHVANIVNVVSDLQTVQAAVGNIITTLKG